MDNKQQINQMIGFIKAEANEKTQEIEQKAAAEYERRFQELKREKEYVFYFYQYISYMAQMYLYNFILFFFCIIL